MRGEGRDTRGNGIGCSSTESGSTVRSIFAWCKETGLFALLDTGGHMEKEFDAPCRANKGQSQLAS